METYVNWPQYTESALSLIVNDNEGNALKPDGVYVTIKTINDIVVIPEQAGMILGNQCLTAIGKTVTNIPDTYQIYWRIIKDEFTYIHLSHLDVTEL